VTRRVTHWFVDTVLARRGFDIGMRKALGAIVRYVIITLGALVILQSAGIDLTSLNVLVGAIGVGLGVGLQNIASNFFSGLILCSNAQSSWGTMLGSAVSLAKCGRSGHAPRLSSPMRALR
jgi:small-conductance mechanosensitive channel